MYVEKDVIEGCKKGNRQSFESLYKKYAGRLLSIAMRYSFTTFEAEDIIQEAFIKIFNSIKSYEYKGSFEGWLKKIVVTTAINHYHKDKTKQSQTDLFYNEEEAFDYLWQKIEIEMKWRLATQKRHRRSSEQTST